MINVQSTTKPPKSLTYLMIITIVALSILAAGFKVFGPAPRSYAFIPVDHPVDMVQDDTSKWSYYSIGEEGATEKFAAKARAELIPQGFSEDTTQRPWFRFVKGNQEVVVCNHHEFSQTNSSSGSTFVQEKRVAHTGSKGWPCVLVKNGPGTETPLKLFTIQKFVRLW